METQIQVITGLLLEGLVTPLARLKVHLLVEVLQIMRSVTVRLLVEVVQILPVEDFQF